MATASGVDPFMHAQTASNVKRIYREEASRLHPNRHPKASDSQKKVYTHRFQEMALSYEEAMQRVSNPAYRASEELRRRRQEERDRRTVHESVYERVARLERLEREKQEKFWREDPDLKATLNALRSGPGASFARIRTRW